MDTSKYLSKPKATVDAIPPGRYERYNLRENPFPSSPFVNPESSDEKTNGRIYEESIRQSELEKVRRNFLEVPQTDPNHLRLGYIEDTSYLGRGNGKSAFIVHLQRSINDDFGLSISNGTNKCFAVRLVPEPGGKTKTFESFVDLFASAILRSTLVEDALASLRLQAILALDNGFDVGSQFATDAELRKSLNSADWFRQAKIDLARVNTLVQDNAYLDLLPPDFPLRTSLSLWPRITTGSDFEAYFRGLKRGMARYEFVFSHLVALFLAADFNGAYVFVDDFERILDFQSERQRRDFALELRSCLFDGLYLNSRIGFYIVLLVLHAGIPRQIGAAWDQSGLEHRAPMSYKGAPPKHVIRFEKITQANMLSLMLKYLDYYRINPTNTEDISPFTVDAVTKIAELSELNAAKALKLAYEVLERAADTGLSTIDAEAVIGSSDELVPDTQDAGGIHDARTKDLFREAK